MRISPEYHEKNTEGCQMHACHIANACIHYALIPTWTSVGGMPEKVESVWDVRPEQSGQYWDVDSWEDYRKAIRNRIEILGCPNADLVEETLSAAEIIKSADGEIYQFESDTNP